MDKSSPLRPFTDPAALESVVITDKLAHRPARKPDDEAEKAALAELAQCLASKPESVLDLLTQKAVELCHAHCAGISIEEGREPGAVFRWKSVSGTWKRYAGGTLPRWNSPCATVLDRGVPQLMTNVHRAYPVPVEPPPISPKCSSSPSAPKAARSSARSGSSRTNPHESSTAKICA